MEGGRGLKEYEEDTSRLTSITQVSLNESASDRAGE